MLIYLLRHGEAVHPTKWSGPDFNRPLSKNGKEEVQKVAKAMARDGIIPEKILSSPFLRAKETAEIVGQELGVEATAVKEFSSGAKSEDFRKVVANYKEDSILVVGHIPDLLSFLCRLIHDALIMEEGMAPAELIAVQTDPIDKGWAGGKFLWRKKPS